LKRGTTNLNTKIAACGTRPDAVKRIFQWIWMSGEHADDPDRVAALCAELGVAEA